MKEKKTLLQQILGISLYALLPLVFFAVLYGMAGFYYMDLDPHKWSESTRLLIAIEGVVMMGVGVGVAAYINSKKY
jgi:hypothetical protein